MFSISHYYSQVYKNAMQRLDENSDTNGKSFNIGSLFKSILLHSISCFVVLVLKSLYMALDIFLTLMTSRSQEYGFILQNAVEHYRGLQKLPASQIQPKICLLLSLLPFM